MAKARARPAPPSPAPAPVTLSPARRRLFVALTLALPWVALAALELGLRAGGYGSSYPLFVEYPDQPGYLFPDREVAKRYFRGGPFVPTPPLDFFRAVKAPGTFRVVFQGESSAAGFPYGHGGTPARMLEERLQETFPDRNIEVVNTGLTAISSYTLLDQADEIIAQHPDAVMIYTGHNEYYGIFGVGSTRALGHWRPLVRAYLALRHLRTVQLLDDALGAAGAEAPSARGTGGGAESPTTVMELMAGDQRIPLGSRRYEQGLAQFRANLADLFARYRAHGIPVFVGTLVSNERDQPPFVSGFAPGADTVAWRRSYVAGTQALARGDTAGAERALTAAVRVDSTAADAWFALGRLHDATGDTARARADYVAAKERDELRFRAPEAMNRVIREEAARAGAVVVESERAVERASPGGIPGHSLILEHLHPNVDGYFVIADAFYAALRAHALPGPWPAPVPVQQARANVPVTPVDSLAALLRTDRLMAGWPFQPRGVSRPQAVDTMQPRTPVERLARDLVLGTVSWPEAMDRQREYFEGAGLPDAAIHVARAMAQEYRYSPQPYMDAARIALAQHRYDEGLRYARLANARRETPNSSQLVGLLLLRRGDQPTAIPYLQRAAQLAPGDQRMTAPLTAAQAIPDLEAERARAPRDTSVLYDLAVVYALTQQYEKSRDALTALQRVAPSHAGARDLLARLPR